MNQKSTPKEIIFPILGVFFKLLLPACLLFFVIWQSVTYAKMNREVRKLSQKKEELFKKNYDLKAKIASTYAADRVENLYNQKYNPRVSYSKDRVITLTLPQERLPVTIEE